VSFLISTILAALPTPGLERHLRVYLGRGSTGLTRENIDWHGEAGAGLYIGRFTQVSESAKFLLGRSAGNQCNQRNSNFNLGQLAAPHAGSIPPVEALGNDGYALANAATFGGVGLGSTAPACPATPLSTKVSPIHIGNDVWIGPDVVIGEGVRIGDGVIVTAGSRVPAHYNIPSYTIISGNPAVDIGLRFTLENISVLEASTVKWWDMPWEDLYKDEYLQAALAEPDPKYLVNWAMKYLPQGAFIDQSAKP
jgi:hypothetical protein